MPTQDNVAKEARAQQKRNARRRKVAIAIRDAAEKIDTIELHKWSRSIEPMGLASICEALADEESRESMVCELCDQFAAAMAEKGLEETFVIREPEEEVEEEDTEE